MTPQSQAIAEHAPLQIVLVHGITGSRRFFAGLENRLRLPPTSATTYSLDLLGFGGNQNVRSEYSAADQLKWIEDSVCEHFPSGNFVLAGHSVGGILCLAWAADHLSRVSKIILLNTPLGENRGDIVRSLLQEHMVWATALLQFRPLAHLACLALRGAHVLRHLRFAKPGYVPNEVFLDYGKHTWKSIARTFDDVLLGLPGMPLVRRLEEVPILNLTGTEDTEISQRTIDRSNVENLKLPGGHLMLLEHPDETFAAVARFLTRDRSAQVGRAVTDASAVAVAPEMGPSSRSDSRSTA